MKSALSQLARRTPEPAISWLMSLTLDHPKLISLAAGFTDNDSLPVAEVREVLDGVLASPRRSHSALQYGSTVGDAMLRELTVAHVQQCDGTKAAAGAPAARTIITSGSQQLLYMITEALCDPVTSCSWKTRPISFISASRRVTPCAAAA